MNLANQMLDDVDTVFLNTEEHAADYTYTPPLGGTPRTVTGIWEVALPHVSKKSGTEVIHTATLIVASSETFAREGKLNVSSEDWIVTQVGSPDVGLRTIYFERQTKVLKNTDGKTFG